MEGKRSGLKYSRINLVARKTGNRLTGSMIYKETMESEFFEEWFRKIYLRDIEKLKENAIIVMDNARFHRKRVLKKIIKETRQHLLFLPYNPIEKVWTNIKKKLKEITHNFNTLEEAITAVLFDKSVQF
ncbi:transposase [Leptotrichia wadei]|uniref:transposase n=1 Tax=Leptotrichia wadei TaxID=157687 RepID=UPI001E3FCB1E|nr:transposase [Leptotrichia wadei]